MIDFSKLSNSRTNIHIEPRDIFMSLPSKDKMYEYPRDVQSEVWKQWFEHRDNKNNIIKMNTGSGKTVVALVILKSCLNEGKGPAVYVVPDDFLVKQVQHQAEKLGILTTRDENDYSFIRKEAILVINVQKLINGKSVFGMREQSNVKIGSIVIDDVHACMASIETQYTVDIPADDEIYKELIDIFSEAMKRQSEEKYYDIVESCMQYQSMVLPFWDWQEKAQQVYKIISAHKEKKFVMFNFPLIKDCLNLCNCVISAEKIEITPKSIPIHKISSFQQAERRVFLSATLADDSIFVSALGLQPEGINNIISPEKANDIGDRLIIFPQVMNKQVKFDAIKRKLNELSEFHNIVVIVPSYYRAKRWEDVANQILNYSNIEEGVAILKKAHVGLTVLINKYDGVDLPNDACRILVIDGLPNMRSEYDVFKQNVNPTSEQILCEQIQKIEQGMGRGVRSNSDYCVVALLGEGLANLIYGFDGYKYFSDATKKQIEISEQLWKQMQDPDVDEIFSLTEYSLKRNIEWVTISKDNLSMVKYSREPNINPIECALRKAFDFAESRCFQDAVDVLTVEKNKAENSELRGFLKQIIAEYVNLYNPEEAQQILLSAIKDNKKVIKPLQGIQFEKMTSKAGGQAQTIIDYVMSKNLSPNQFILRLNSILEELDFEPDSAKRFEAAIQEVSPFIGIVSSRPENEYGKGPDNFWILDSENYLVIECKNGTITEMINKHDCNQLNGSINWFVTQYKGVQGTCHPIMIHNSDIFENACSPNLKIRIMTPTLLKKFKENIRQFAMNAVKPENYNNVIQLTTLLQQFKLIGVEIVKNYTNDFSIKR